MTKKYCGYAISHTDGSAIFYETSAAPQGARDVVLCDGIGCHGYVWKYLRPELIKHYRVIHSHYRGHGRTPVPKDTSQLGIADLADDLATVLETTHADRSVLIAHSMGVQVALETFRRHPNYIAGLVLMCGSPENPLRTFRGGSNLERALPTLLRMAKYTPRVLQQMFQSVVPTRLGMTVAKWLEVNPELLIEEDFMPYLQGISEIEPSVFLGMLHQATQHSARDLLPDISVPTLIVAGSKDSFTPSELSLAMQDNIPDAELLVVQDGSHTAPIERPKQVNAAIDRFLSRVYL